MRQKRNQTVVVYFNAAELVVGPNGVPSRGFRVELSQTQPSIAFDRAKPRPGEEVLWVAFLEDVSVMGECE